MRIDAHQHFWRVDRGDYGWLNPADHPAICRDFGPEDLAPLIADAGVERTILVQAAPTLEETRFLLDLARRTDFVAGVVGWVDLAAPDAAVVIANLARDPKLVGLRPMLQDLPDDGWILGADLALPLKTLQTTGLRFDALVKPRHLPYLAAFLAAHRDLPVVIDHGAKPDIARGERGGWADAIAAIGRDTHAYCKLSGLVSEAAADWKEADLRPYFDVLLQAFGPGRLMWGSDWPVVNEAGGYAAWRAAAEALTEVCSAADREWIFGRSAQTFYGIGA
ncbi:MAG: amidohydrolase family protein [Caulobacterales bacterium]